MTLKELVNSHCDVDFNLFLKENTNLESISLWESFPNWKKIKYIRKYKVFLELEEKEITVFAHPLFFSYEVVYLDLSLNKRYIYNFLLKEWEKIGGMTSNYYGNSIFDVLEVIESLRKPL